MPSRSPILNRATRADSWRRSRSQVRATPESPAASHMAQPRQQYGAVDPAGQSSNRHVPIITTDSSRCPDCQVFTAFVSGASKQYKTGPARVLLRAESASMARHAGDGHSGTQSAV